MRVLLDTNVVSELVRPRPSDLVAAWIDRQDEDSIFLSVASLAELRDGIDRLPTGARQRQLDRWLSDELSQRFEGRILGVDTALADAWGRTLARGRALGRPMSAMDALLAATAIGHDLVLATRNVRDFAVLGVKIVDPWKEG